MREAFTKEQLSQLRRNPNVYAVSTFEIRYTNDFKLQFIKQYMEGKGPAQIFAEAGLPSALIGYKRIERACYRWKRAFEKGVLTEETEHPCRDKKQKALLSIIAEQQRTIRRLQNQLALHQMLDASQRKRRVLRRVRREKTESSRVSAS